ncbi:MAG: glycerate kinase [Dehalococcoidia bacterium]|nr:glycerate kinase [Dehalococcoidia bacterium]
MKIVIAPTAFKGSLSPLQASKAIELGVRSAMPEAETILVPVADGGDGTVEAIHHAQGGAILEQMVSGPLGGQVRASWALLSDGMTGVIEMASASGIALLGTHESDPLRATTYGVGELVRDALDKGCERLIIGLGGSATIDGGAGMAQALGVELLDRRGHPLPRGGEALARLDRIYLEGLDPRVKKCHIAAAYDVSNPLLGPQGAAAVFGPQKGASGPMIQRLENALARLAKVIKRDIGLEVGDRPGAGAAGGLGAGLLAFLGASLMPGAELVLETIRLREKLKGADLVIIGEGSLDFQSAYGKAPMGVVKIARDLSIPVLALAGNLGQGQEILFRMGVDAAMSIVPGPMSLGDAQRDAYDLLAGAAERALRMVALGRRLDYGRQS